MYNIMTYSKRKKISSEFDVHVEKTKKKDKYVLQVVFKVVTSLFT
jgi:hypothetical protein